MNEARYRLQKCVLSTDDVIGFGSRTTKYDSDDRRVYAYKVHCTSQDETIALSDDEYESEPKKMKIEPIEKTERTDNEKTDEENDDSEPSYDYDDFRRNFDFMNFETTRELLNTIAEVSTGDLRSSHEAAPMPAPGMDFMPTISIENDVRAEIKQEISWFTHEYDRTVANQPKSEPEVIDHIDICDSDDDSPPIVPSTAPPRVRKSTAKSSNSSRQSECQSANVSSSSEMVSKPAQVLKKKPGLTETERQRLIDKISFDSKLLKAKAHVSINSRSQRLALDMLGICEAPQNANMPNANSGSSITTKSTIKSNAEKSAPPAAFAIDDNLPCDLTFHENEFVSEITNWNVKWLVDNQIDAPVADADTLAHDIPTNFRTASEYVRTMAAFLKQELWLSILAQPPLTRPYGSIFAKLNVVKYATRNGQTRAVYICEAETSIDELDLQLYADHLVLVKHTHGRFFAFVTKISYMKIGELNQKHTTFARNIRTIIVPPISRRGKNSNGFSSGGNEAADQ